MRAFPPLRRIAVIGAGRAGRDFTLRCLRAGLHVTLEDVMPSRLRHAERTLATIPEIPSATTPGAPSATALGAPSATTLGAPSSARGDASRPEAKVGPHDISSGQLHLASSIEDAVRHADLAIDFVPDELESKLEIFSLLDRMAPPHTLLCTPTRELSISDLASCTYRPQLCFALQIDSAEHSSPAAHLIRTICSEPAAISAIELWLRSMGFTVSLELDRAETMLVSRAANSAKPGDL